MKFSYPPKFEHDNEPALWQNPWEFRQTMRVIKSLKTKSLLEIGTGWGLFAKYLRTVLSIPVKSIDKDPFNNNIYLIQNNHLLLADSCSQEAFEWAFEHSPKRGYDVVYIDGAHDYDSCLHDFTSYSKLAKKAVMIHDIAANQEGKYPVDHGSSEAWDEVIKPQHKTIELHAPEPENCGVGIVLL